MGRTKRSRSSMEEEWFMIEEQMQTRSRSSYLTRRRKISEEEDGDWKVEGSVQRSRNYDFGEYGERRPPSMQQPSGDSKQFCLCRSRQDDTMMIYCEKGEKTCPLGGWCHFRCVGLVKTPPGDWYCPVCDAMMKKHKK